MLLLMMMLDLEDRFQASCAVSSTYPANLLSTGYSKRKLLSYTRTLENERPRLFDESRSSLKITEFKDGNCLRSYEAKNQPELAAHLQRSDEDPQVRYVAIESSDSRSPLSCSHSMFTYLSTFHQISPSFIPAVCSFGRVLEPKDVCLAFCDTGDSLLAPPSRRVLLPTLGRSGSEIQLSYLLRVVEKSKSREPWSFIVRPLAIYHSYDVQTARTLWVTVKGNSSTREQICETLDNPLQSEQSGIAHAFAATLDIHLSILETVEENWQVYINEMDQAIRETVSKACNARIDIGPQFKDLKHNIEQQLGRTGTNQLNQVNRTGSILQSIKSGLQKTLSKKSLDDPPKPSPNILKELHSWWKRVRDASNQKTPQDEEDEIEDILEKYLKLDMFSFEDNQNLHRHGEAVQEAILTIKLDTNVMQELREFYQCDAVRQSIFTDNNEADSEFYYVKAFSSRLKSLENSMRIKQQQLESLESFIREAKVLYDGVSQYRSVQISRLYAHSAQASAQRMEKIAGITEKETASMHIITLVTLVFLPGTFIAVRLAMPSLSRSVEYLTTNSQSFLQSGIFQWKEDDTIDSAWMIRSPVFQMFMEICVVMMFVTFLVWFFVFRCLRGRSRGQHGVIREEDASEKV